MFVITEKAAQQIKKVSDEEKIGHYSVRVKLKGGGCYGMVQVIEFNNDLGDNDEVIELYNVRVIIDHISAQYMSEAILDYKSGLMAPGFIFIDPNVKTTCGCNKSVGY